jgi:plasmid stability protein
MAQALIRKIKDETLEAYRASARKKGVSLEAELREVVERNAPIRRKDPEALLALSRRLTAMTLKPGKDSTPFIRWARDTNGGRLPGSPPFVDDDAGR